jgi:hypothetical protein
MLYGRPGNEPAPHANLVRLVGDYAITLEAAATRVEVLLAVHCDVRQATDGGVRARPLSDAQVKNRRRVRAGERQSELAAEYDVNRKTIRRRLDAAERAEAERHLRTAAKCAAQTPSKWANDEGGHPPPEHARPLKPANRKPANVRRCRLLAEVRRRAQCVEGSNPNAVLI